MVGISVNDAITIVESARNKGLLIVPAGHDTIRLLPPLIASAQDLDQSVTILESVFKELSSH